MSTTSEIKHVLCICVYIEQVDEYECINDHMDVKNVD